MQNSSNNSTASSLMIDHQLPGLSNVRAPQGTQKRKLPGSDKSAPPITKKSKEPRAEGENSKKKRRRKRGPRRDNQYRDKTDPAEYLRRNYEVVELLGSGGFGKVYSGIRRKDNLPVAIKEVCTDKITEWGQLNGRNVPMEICLLKKVSQLDGVIKMLDWLDAGTSYIIVMERPEKVNDLFDYISQRGVLDENTAKDFLRQVLEAVRNIHEAGVVHRDIKDENILVDLTTEKLKLIDFGAGAFFKDTEYLTYYGTREYNSPEMILDRGYYAKPAAVWSLGVLLHVMVCGDVPFETNKQITKAELDFKNCKQKVSYEVQDLIKKCLSVRASDRPTVEEMLGHTWMRVHI